MAELYSDYPLPDGWYLIPEYMHEGVYNYVMHGHPVGGFLTAVISDAPISEVYARADDTNQKAMLGWMKFIYNFMPSNCRRSNMARWMEEGGMQKFKERADD